MGYRLLADLTLVLHLAFIVFALFGGLLCLRRAGYAWLHLPTVTWGIWIEWSGSICPLTPLENHFRKLAYGHGYQGGFIEHYLLPLIYPGELTMALQWVLGGLLLAVNISVYIFVFHARKKMKRVDE